MQDVEKKKNWTLSADAFRGFLVWIGDDPGEPYSGERYLEIRRRLVAYFDRKNCLQPDELADETLNRVARRLEEEGEIDCETPFKYCYITARFVFMESLRASRKSPLSLDLVPPEKYSQSTRTDCTEEASAKEKMLDCLDHCVGQLDRISRDIILSYYHGDGRGKIENRRGLAESLGISGNALSIRACRIRDKLEVCVKKCVDRETK